MHKLILIAVVTTAAAVAGCGGADKTLTKSEVIKQGGVICRTAEKRVERLPQLTVEHPFAKGTAEAVHEKARKFLAGYADALEYSRAELGKLAAPKQDRQLLDGYLHDIGVVAARIRAASKAPNSSVEKQASAAFGLFARASSQTKRYGFPRGVCGAGGS
jgi:hypothetical protein